MWSINPASSLSFSVSFLSSSSSSSTMFLFVFVTTIIANILVFPVANAQRYADDSYSYYYNYNTNNNNQDSYGMGEYLSDWNHQEWAKMSGRIQQPKCIDIPANLTLCHGIGYEKMMLPNLLDHDSLSEVTQQAGSWVPLVRINCHPDAKVFLCSLFSPVCLDRLIYPCRSLCEGVQASCVGRMKTYGFDWPEMLKCDKFPLDNDMCIKLIHDVKPDNNCTACKHPLTHESLIDHFCRADIAMRVNLKDFKDTPEGHKELVLRKKKKLFKHEGLKKREARALRAIIEGGAGCNCDTINSTQERYLLMGNKRDDDFVINFGMVWNRKDKEFKKGIRAIRKGNTCEGIFRELSANGIENNKSSSKGGKGGDKKRRKKGKKGKKRKGKKGKKRRGRKGKKGRKGRKNKDKNDKDNKKGESASTNDASRRNSASKTELEDQALSNFMKAAN